MLKSFARYYKPHWKLFVLDMVCALIAASCDPDVPCHFPEISSTPTFRTKSPVDFFLVCSASGHLYHPDHYAVYHAVSGAMLSVFACRQICAATSSPICKNFHFPTLMNTKPVSSCPESSTT